MKNKSKRRIIQYACDLMDAFVKETFDIIFYNYQKRPADAVIKRVLSQKGGVIPIEFSRQSGKTTMIVCVVVFLSVFIFALGKKVGYHFRKLAGRPVFTIIIFAPVIDQAKTDFDAIKNALDRLKVKYTEEVCVDANWKISEEERNANTLALENGVTIHIFSLSPNSHPESKTADLIIYEESQHIQDHRLENVAQPMAAATDALEVFIGTAGYQRCHFSEHIEKIERQGGELFIADRETVIQDKRERYELDGDEFHLKYKRKTDQIIDDLGENSDAVKTQYLLIWVTGSGMFFSDQSELESCQGAYEEILSFDKPTYVFIDWAKRQDRTVVTFMDSHLRILSWLEFSGDKYNEQWEQIARKCENYKVERIGMDSTGTQDSNLDWVSAWITEKKSNLPVPCGIDYTLQNKDIMFRKLWYVTHDTIVEGEVKHYSQLRFPRTETAEKRRFMFEFLYLQKDIVQGKYWSCHAPAGDKYGDDYCDSTAGAVALVLNLLEFYIHSKTIFEAGVLFT